MTTTLDELFTRDPLTLTDQNIATLVDHYRAERANTPTAKPKKATEAASSISVDEIMNLIVSS